MGDDGKVNLLINKEVNNLSIIFEVVRCWCDKNIFDWVLTIGC